MRSEPPRFFPVTLFVAGVFGWFLARGTVDTIGLITSGVYVGVVYGLLWMVGR